MRAAPARQVNAATTPRHLKPKALLALIQLAQVASFSIASKAFVALALPTLLAACATLQDAPRLTFLCTNNLRFEARLYQDMALLEGLRGHAVLERAADDSGEAALLYADATVRARFGLGLDGRLARLDYTRIPEPVYCERAVTARPGEPPAVSASDRPGPRPPPPRPDPNAPIETNIHLGDGRNGPG